MKIEKKIIERGAACQGYHKLSSFDKLKKIIITYSSHKILK